MRVKTLILASTAAGAFALSAGAASADPNGWYGAIDAGWHTADVETNRSIDEFEVDDDWAGFARLGYRFTENWRVEIEAAFGDFLHRDHRGELLGDRGPAPHGIRCDRFRAYNEDARTAVLLADQDRALELCCLGTSADRRDRSRWRACSGRACNGGPRPSPSGHG